jgi:TatD DNase family protein
MDRLLIETDCPYMAPVPLRGKRCDSTMLPHTAAVMAGLKGVATQELIDQTTQNACNLFQLQLP